MKWITKAYWIKFSFFILSLFIFSKLVFFQINVSQKATDENVFQQSNYGVEVIAVNDGGASQRAGMEVGDIIVKIDNQSFKTSFQADSILRSIVPGRTVEYDIIRNGENKTLFVTIATQSFKFYNFLAILNCLGLLILANIAMNKSHVNNKVIIYSLSLAIASMPIVIFLALPFVLTPIINALLIIGIYLGFPLVFHSLLFMMRERRIDSLTSIFIRISYIIGGIMIIVIVLLQNFGPYIFIFLNLDQFTIQILVSSLSILFYISIILFTITGNIRNKFFTKEILLIYSSWFVCILSLFLYSFFLFRGSNTRLFFVLPIFMPIVINYYYFIKKRFFNIDVVVNRSVKFQIVRFLVLFTLISVFFISLTFITNIELNNYSFNLSYTGLEISDKPIEGFSDRPLFMILGIASFLLLIYLYKLIMKFVKTKFSREEYNYKKALNEINNLLADKLLADEVFGFIVQETMRIMRIQGIALLLNKEENFFVQSISGFSENFRNDLKDKDFPNNLFTFYNTTIISNHPIRNIFSLNEIQLVVPLTIDQTFLGYFLLGGKKSEDVYNQSDIEFIESVSKQIIILLENKRLTHRAVETEKIHHELKIAKRLQENLLPKEIPEKEHLDISTYYTSAREVGGDYYDILNNQNDDQLYVLGDVSGKGVSASLYMSRFQGVMRAFIQMGKSSPKELLTETNAIVQKDMEKNAFVTCICVKINHSVTELNVSRAGHLPLFQYKASEKCIVLHEPKGMALGLTHNEQFNSVLVEESVNISTGDIFILCSDGVTEAMNTHRDEYGFDRLETLVMNHSETTASQIKDTIVADLKEFTGDTDPTDDIAIIIIKVI